MRGRNLFSVLGAARCVAAGFLGAVALAGGAWAVPPTVNVHGQLLDGDGQALTGTRAYRIRFYDASTGGAQLGGDVAGTAALSSKGLFNLSIVPPAAALASPTLFYEAAVDSSPTPNGVDAADVFPERVKVESVPFALEAETVTQVDADRVGGGMVSNGEFAHLDGVTGALQPQLDAKADAAAVAVSQAAQDAIIAQKLTFAWGEETGTAVQAAPNRGYVCTNAAQAVVTLPPTASLSVGDVVRVSASTGGWRIAQNAGQQVTLTSPGQDSTSLLNWHPRGGYANWRGVASSSDGARLAATRENDQIYTSSDFGQTWTARESARNWRGIASSSDGQKLVALVNFGQIYTSTNAGVSWTARESARAWYQIASSGDGTKLVASVSSGQLYTSADSGVTWVARDTNRNWRSVASSSDGTKLVAVVTGGQIYTSVNSGATWTARASIGQWFGVASSADGVRLVATGDNGAIHTSSDSGISWTPRTGALFGTGVASSADGSRLYASTYQANTDQIYSSRDYGITWTPQTASTPFLWVACSSDGTRAVAAGYPGVLFVTGGAPLNQRVTTVGTGGYLLGSADSGIELQYLGGGRFMALSFTGAPLTY